MNIAAWLTVVQALASAYATSQGKDLRALGYLRVATTGINGSSITDAERASLMAEYTTKVARAGTELPLVQRFRRHDTGLKTAPASRRY